MTLRRAFHYQRKGAKKRGIQFLLQGRAMVPASYPRVMGTRQSGPGTATGAGDIIYDDRGREYQVVSNAEAQTIKQSTGGHVYELCRDGTIR